MSTIIAIKGRMVYDSRGFPTTEIEVTTRDGVFRSTCPSGASTGEHEALELRDGVAKDWTGKGVTKALAHITEVFAPALIGMDVTNQRAIDEKMIEIDGHVTFSEYGANAALPISMACCQAGAAAVHKPLHEYIAELSGRGLASMRTPVPCMNVINGGCHAGNELAPQEYMIAPFGATTFAEAMKMGSEVYHALKGILRAKYGAKAISVGDEGGFAPPITNPREPLEVIMAAIEKVGLVGKVGICLDVAASEMLDKETRKYDLAFKSAERHLISGEELAKMYLGWMRDFPIISIEDPFDENDFESFARLMEMISEAKLPVQVVGDDLTVSQVPRVKTAIAKKACSSLLLKINQVGCITGAIESAMTAMEAGWTVMVSHRSGETEDTFIAPLVVGLGTGQIKSGAPCRSERTAKYNEILRIEERMGGAPYGNPVWK